MGTWGYAAFDNDTACDWAYGLEEVDDLSHIESTFAALEAVADKYIDDEVGSNALAACEVVARLRGKVGVQNAYTEPIDLWIAQHKLSPPPKLIVRALTAIQHILGDNSEVAQLWEESGDREWREAVEELRGRLQG